MEAEALVDPAGGRSGDRGMLAAALWWSLRVLLVAAILDALTTYLAFARPGAHERNPVAMRLIETVGLPGALLFRALTGVAYFVVLGWAFRRRNGLLRVATCIVAVGTAAFWWMVVVNNVTVLAT